LNAQPFPAARAVHGQTQSVLRVRANFFVRKILYVIQSLDPAKPGSIAQFRAQFRAQLSAQFFPGYSPPNACFVRERWHVQAEHSKIPS
jgi:hypothetical protein